jgi:hypothetical protein
MSGPIRIRTTHKLLALVGLTSALVMTVPVHAASGVSPDITGVLSQNQTIDPGEVIKYDVAATGVAATATVTFSGEGVEATIVVHRSTRLRLSVVADLDAPPGPRDLTITNPDGLSDTLPYAIVVAGGSSEPVGDVVGRVFEDLDGNGVEGADEIGLAEVGVSLNDTNGQVATALTNSNGDFRIDGVPVGEVTLVVSGPSSYTATTGNETQIVSVTGGDVTSVEPVGYQPPSDALPGSYVEEDVHFLLDARSLQLEDGEAVTSWHDDISGIEFTVPATGDAPSFTTTSGFEGLPSVEFDGVDDVLEATFGELNTESFAVHAVVETVTYQPRSAIVSRRAGAPLDSKNLIGYDDYDENRVLFGEPAWVSMSGPNGTQAEHFHPILSSVVDDTRNSPTDITTDAANRVVLTYVVRDSGQIRFWDRLDDLLDVTMRAAGNDLKDGLRIGGREDDTSFANFRLAYLIVVDESPYGEDDLLAAAAELGTWFNVPGLEG